MTKVNYKVFKKVGDRTPVITLSDIPKYQLRGKKKFVGKKAKIEAIFRAFGTRLPDDSKTEQVNQYVAENIFKTPKWAIYVSKCKEVRNEVETVPDIFEFQYVLEVVFDKDVDAADERIIYMVTAELMGKDVQEYKGLKNSIVSLKKNYEDE